MIPVLNTSLPQAPAGDTFAQRLVNRLDRLLREIDTKIEIFKQSLNNVNNTSDANKPISTATQEALDLKAPLANPTFTGRIQGDFSNATQSQRLLFQTATTNSFTNVGLIPNGTSAASLLTCFSSVDPANASVAQFRIDGGDTVKIASEKTGTASYLPLTFHTSSSERLRITHDGRIGANIGNPQAYFHVAKPDNTINITTVQVDGYGASRGYGMLMLPSTDSNVPIIFLNSSASTCGSIQCTASATSYVTSSDYRLKENVQPMTGAVETLQRLNPVTYNWKHDGSAGQGFIAHELQEVFPDAVAGEKDAVDENGKIVPQGIDTSFLVATLVKAVQEQQRMIKALSERVDTLEAGN